MREIVFKAKRVDDGEWVDGDLVSYEDAAIIRAKGLHIGTRWHVVDPETVCQYTGLRDRNGKMIFEGDLMRYNGSARGIGWSIEHAKSTDSGVVEFSYEYAGGWVIVAGGKSLNIGTKSDKFEITGNIHDTTEEKSNDMLYQ